MEKRNIISRKILSRLVLIAFLLTLLSSHASYAAESLLDLNTATVEQLQELPFIGKARARAIVRHREKNGAFTRLDELLKSPAIGKSTYEAVKPYLTLAGSSNKNPEETQQDSAFIIKPQIITKPGEIIILPDNTYFGTLMNFIRFAESRIDLVMFIFKASSSPKNKPSLLVKALVAARNRGVIVNVLLENSGYDESINEENQRVASQLKKHGVNVRFDSPNTTTHTKAVIIDNRFCFIGSHNFTQSALGYNHELSLLIDNQTMAKEFQDYINEIK